MAGAPEFPAWAVEKAARQLQITLRQLRQAQGTLYFCTLPSGLRFDLYAGLDGTLQCWQMAPGGRKPAACNAVALLGTGPLWGWNPQGKVRSASMPSSTSIRKSQTRRRKF